MKLTVPFVLILGLAVLLSAGAGYALRSATEADEEPSVSAPVETSPSPAIVTPTGPATVAGTEVAASPQAELTATPQPGPTAADSPAQDFEVTVVSVFEQDPGYTVDVEYPQLGLSFDSRIAQVVDTGIAEIKELARTNPPGASGIPGPYAIDVSFEAVYLSPEIVSIRLHMYTYTGGAHGNGRIFGFNFDPSTGKELTVDDALALLGLPLAEVAAQVSTELAARLGDAFFEEGALPQEENYQTFLVSGSQVTFVFQQYQVAPYAAGHQEVSLPRVDVR